MKRIILTVIFISIALIFQYPAVFAQDFPDVCQQSENIMPNCTFDNGLEGWQKFTEAGGADISVLQGGGGCHAPLCPAGYIVVENHFIGGIYQQVAVTAGNTYYTNIVWLAFDTLANDASINSVVGGIGRRIGIDPYGGTDSRSSNIIWSEDNWRNDCKICNVEQAIATAKADTITIFLRIDDTWKLRAAEKGYSPPPSKDQFWLDDIGLKQVDSNQAPPPTDTPTAEATQTAKPSTNTPIPKATKTTKPPTDTPIPEIAQTDEPSDIQTVESADVSKNRIAPPPTITPTTTPTPTSVVKKQPTPTITHQPTLKQPASEISFGLSGIVVTTFCLGGLSLLVIAIMITGLFWLYRMGWGNIDDE